jgi:prevent-host-death family protein
VEPWYIFVMDSIRLLDFKDDCLEVLEKARRTGQPVLITDSGEPVAEIIPFPGTRKPERWLGCLRTTGRILGDLVAPAVDETDWEALRA